LLEFFKRGRGGKRAVVSAFTKKPGNVFLCRLWSRARGRGPGWETRGGPNSKKGGTRPPRPMGLIGEGLRPRARRAGARAALLGFERPSPKSGNP